MALSSIQCSFPKDSAGISENLFELVGLCPSVRTQEGIAEISATFAPGATPTTRFVVDDIDEPRISFIGTGLDISLRCDGRSAREWLRATLVDVTEVIDALSGRVLWIDHTGLNMPAAPFGRPWEQLVRSLGNASLMYSYPTGEPWFFILPGTPDEQKSGIATFPSNRVPRFELVELSEGACAAIQIDIQTDLSHAEVIERFPGSQSAALPGLENYFRSVFVSHPWKGLEIRLDIRFGPGDSNGAWETGAWLVQNGRRCNNHMQRIPRA